MKPTTTNHPFPLHPDGQHQTLQEPAGTARLAQALAGLLGFGSSAVTPFKPWTVKLEKIGRGNSGKSVIEWALTKAVVSNFLPSGLQLDHPDPQMVAEMLHKNRNIRVRLEQDPLLPTLEPDPIHYTLFEGDLPRVILLSHEVIGQILTETKPSSPPEWQARYREYMDRLSRADVLWAVLPLPPAQATAIEQEQFDDDLKITTGYLRKALELRSSQTPCAAAIVLTRVDTLFDSAAQAVESLTPEMLQRLLTPLITLVRMASKVSDAAVIPTASFGFGNAVRKPEAPRPAKQGEPTVPRVREDGVWILRPDARVTPFNLDVLAVWTLLHGLIKEKVVAGSETEAVLGNVVRLLKDDLTGINGCFVAIKTRRNLAE